MRRSYLNKRAVLKMGQSHKLGLKGLAYELGISKSYMSMLLSGKRPATPRIIAGLTKKFPQSHDQLVLASKGRSNGPA